MVVTSIPAHFLRLASDFLAMHEAQSSLVLGLVGAIDSGRVTDPLFAVFQREGATTGVAALANPNKLVLAGSAQSGLRQLVDRLHQDGRKFPGFVGPLDTADAFAAEWNARAESRFYPHMQMGLYELSQPARLDRRASGQFRKARQLERETLVRWCEAFGVETRMPGTPDQNAKLIHQMLEDGRLYVWEDGGRIVSMAGWAGPTATGCRINEVYTPPELRGRGYAASCVAELVRHLFFCGRSRCFLFTDLENETSNRLYQRLGFKQLAVFRNYMPA